MTIFSVLAVCTCISNGLLTSSTKVSPEGYKTLEEAQRFCAGRTLAKQIDSHNFTADDGRFLTAYTIHEIDVK